MIPRRTFLTTTAAASVLAQTGSIAESNDATDNRTIRVGVMGLGRGLQLATDLAALPNVQVAYLCDADLKRVAAGQKTFQDKVGRPSEGVQDFRRILDDPSIDAMVCAAPNHWHAPATIMACKAGKHVYVEKPCSHNPLEGEWMIAAAQQYKCCVQMGTQRRSSPGTQEAIAKLHSGVIGKVHLSRCFYQSLRGTIGKVADSQLPADLDYELWQGPVPRRPYRSNYVHYHWHWFWHWGGGELANNGVHGLDLCRWGLQVDYPVRTVSSGGRYWFDDDQETPDTQIVGFEFPDRQQITMNSMSCNKRTVDYFCAFYGSDGTLELDGDGRYKIFDKNDKLVEVSGQNNGGQMEHLTNFIQCVRTGRPEELRQPIVEAHKSTLLCHLGNIAQRTGRTVITDPANGHILNDNQQSALWSREYHPDWQEAVSMP
jgi:predicted dehydrogenase